VDYLLILKKSNNEKFTFKIPNKISKEEIIEEIKNIYKFNSDNVNEIKNIIKNLIQIVLIKLKR
jgi:ribosomal protein L23